MVTKRLINLNFFASIILLLIVGCHQNSKELFENEIQDFDITPDGEHIVFSWKDDRKTSLYKVNIDGTNPRLLSPKQDMLFENPSCSLDGQKIVFLASKLNSLTSSIYTIGINGDSLMQITSGKTLIMEAVFSNTGESIYFTQANEYASYSPIGRKAPHDFDIYNIRLNDKKTSKISNLNAYSLSGISDVDSTRLLLSLRDSDNGIFFYEKNRSGLDKIIATNDTLRNSKSYSNPILIDAKNIICSSSYKLVKIDLEAKKEKQLLPSSGSHFRTIRYNKKRGRVYLGVSVKLTPSFRN